MRISGRTGIAPGTALGLALVLAPMLAPCGAAAQDGVPALAAAYDASGLSLLQQLSAKDGAKDVVLSPLSIGTAMAMALSGARGETATELAKGLHQTLDRTAMEAANAALRAELNGYDKSAVAPRCPPGFHATNGRCEMPVPAEGVCPTFVQREGSVCIQPGSFPASVRLLSANALMLPGRGELVASDYATLLADKYGAEVLHDIGVDDVNAWVKRKTEGKIDKIIDQVDPASAAVLLNAVYFKGKWSQTFAKSATKDDVFSLTAAKKIQVPTMRRAGHYAVAGRPLYEAIRLPYEVGAIGMVVLRPRDINGLDAVTHKLDAAEWASLLADLHKPVADKVVDLTLPRFNVRFGADLVAPFRAEGMHRPFEIKLADFSGISGRPPAQEPMAIGAIAHRAVVDVMEDGTEAAAATAVTVVAAAMRREPEPPPQPFHVDRPFLFAIVDDASGAIMFLGRVADPR